MARSGPVAAFIRHSRDPSAAHFFWSTQLSFSASLRLVGAVALARHSVVGGQRLATAPAQLQRYVLGRDAGAKQLERGIASRTSTESRWFTRLHSRSSARRHHREPRIAAPMRRVTVAS